MEVPSINERVQKSKNNKEEINSIIEEYKPFIASCVKSVTGRYVRYGEDEELSIALMAFNEAIKAYKIDAGNFLPFAKNVIKRRLIDYFRKEKNQRNFVSIGSGNDDDDYAETDYSIGQSVSNYRVHELNYNRRLEIEELRKELSGWNISLHDLLKSSPKHIKTRDRYKEIVNFLIGNEEMLKNIKVKKYLPTMEIEKNLSIPRKKIERGRRYIVASVIIATGDFQYIREFLDL